MTMAKLVDGFGRRIEYLRLSVTDRCDLRCSYCMPADHRNLSEPDHWLTFGETEQIVRVFAGMGLHHLRITGGEPLVRRNVTGLIHRLHDIPGIDDLSLSTNATRLGRMADELKQAGISRINVSLDTLNPDTFRQITKGKLEKVLAGLQAAKKAGLSPIKINMVVMEGVNVDEVDQLVEFCGNNDFTLRMIETMPQGDTGRSASRSYVSLQKITPMSQHFCETCNRVRLSVEGTLYLCLGQDDKVELRPLVRAGISDDDLQQVLIKAIASKPERHDFNDQPGKIVRFMSMTGG